MINTSTFGIFQSDIIIRTAIQAGFDDLRKNLWLLDYAFAGLAKDDLTSKQYGEKEIENAKKWFKENQITILMAYKPSEPPKTPLIAISLEDSMEEAATLADNSAEGPQETINTKELTIYPNSVLGPFTPKSYDSDTGTIELPSSLTTANIYPNMVIYDTTINQGYVIREIVSDTEFTIDEDVKANFTKAIIGSADQMKVVKLESIIEKEAYSLDLYVSGSDVQLMYLYTLVKFVLYRYKQSLLEARGFERSVIGSSGLRLLNNGNPEIIYTRRITLSGFVRQYWPKDVTGRIDGISFGEGILIKDGPKSPDAMEDEIKTAAWIMEGDSLGE